MNNRWIYGLELAVFGLIAWRGGLGAWRRRLPAARALGAMALLAAVATVALLVAFALNRPVPPLLHFTPIAGVLLVVASETGRAARFKPGWTAPLVGVYATLALLLPRPAPRAEEPDAATPSDDRDWDDA